MVNDSCSTDLESAIARLGLDDGHKEDIKSLADIYDKNLETSADIGQTIQDGVAVAYKKALRRKMINQNAQIDIVNGMYKSTPKNPLLSASSRILGSNGDFQGASRSGWNDAKAVADKATQALNYEIDQLTDGGGTSIVKRMQKDPAFTKEVVLALGSPKYKVSEYATKAAHAIKAHLKKAVDRYNSMGGEIVELEDYRYTQSWDAHKLGKAYSTTGMTDREFRAHPEAEKINIASYQAKMLELLDHDRTFGTDATSDEKLEFLRNAFLATRTGVRFSPTEAERSSAPLRRLGTLMSRHNHNRLFHFKDTEAFYHADQLFGKGDPYNSIMRSVESLSFDSEVMRQFGTDPVMTFEKIKLATKPIYDDTEAGRKMYRKLSNRIENHLNMLTGIYAEQPKSMANTVVFALNTMQSVAKIAGAVVPAIPGDMATTVVALSELNGKVFKNLFAARRMVSSDEHKAVLRSTGTFYSLLHGHMFRETVNPGSSLGSSITSGLNKMMLVSGLPQWTSGFKRAASICLNQALSEELSSAKTRKGALEALFHAGFTEHETNFLRSQVQTIKGVRLIDPDTFHQGDVQHVIKERGLPKSAESSVREDLAVRYMGMLQDKLSNAVIESDPKVRAFAKRTLSPVMRSAMDAVMLFKSFPSTIIQKWIVRPIQQKHMGFVGKTAMVGSAMAAFTGAGYLAMQAEAALGNDHVKKQLAQDPFSVFRAAMLKGGGLGLLGDVVFGEMPWYYKTASLAGPDVADIMKTVTGAGQILSGDVRPGVRQITDVGLNMVPLHSLPLIKNLYFKYCYDNMMKWVDPKYKLKYHD